MAELEIHHESEHEHQPDPLGRTVGILAAGLAVLLAIVTIASHRTHTAALIHKSTANDQWAYYQATRMKFHNVELSQSLITAFGLKTDAAGKLLADDLVQMKKYDQQSKDLQAKAQELDEHAERDESRALRYDIGEGMLEIGVVLSSLYFIGKKKMFPVMGATAGIIGALVALSGVFMGQ